MATASMQLGMSLKNDSISSRRTVACAAGIDSHVGVCFQGAPYRKIKSYPQ